jgi:uncharacterized membrane protein
VRHADLLAEIPLFQGLTPAHRAELGRRLTLRTYSAGEPVFSAGDAGHALFVVASGAVEVFLPPRDGAGERVHLSEVRAGEYVGEMALFDDQPRSASAVATVDTVLLELTRKQFVEHLRHVPDAALVMLHDMAQRIRQADQLIQARQARNAVAEVEDSLRWDQRLADRVAELNGSWTFILFLLGLTVLWAAINLPVVAAWLGYGGAPGGFDPYPYIFYNLLLAILVALQGPLIMMSQNRQSLKDRRQAEVDFRVNLKNEMGVERLQHELAAFRAETRLRLDGLERNGVRS